uniref:Uncharacterized protein n=1 Tax=Sphaerodactylus townsendi TaxID=933632 RepID=A0ACB8GD80_9SAUR
MARGRIRDRALAGYWCIDVFGRSQAIPGQPESRVRGTGQRSGTPGPPRSNNWLNGVRAYAAYAVWQPYEAWQFWEHMGNVLEARSIAGDAAAIEYDEEFRRSASHSATARWGVIEQRIWTLKVQAFTKQGQAGQFEVSRAVLQCTWIGSISRKESYRIYRSIFLAAVSFYCPASGVSHPSSSFTGAAGLEGMGQGLLTPDPAIVTAHIRGPPWRPHRGPRQKSALTDHGCCYSGRLSPYNLLGAFRGRRTGGFLGGSPEGSLRSPGLRLQETTVAADLAKLRQSKTDQRLLTRSGRRQSLDAWSHSSRALEGIFASQRLLSDGESHWACNHG